MSKNRVLTWRGLSVSFEEASKLTEHKIWDMTRRKESKNATNIVVFPGFLIKLEDNRTPLLDVDIIASDLNLNRIN